MGSINARPTPGGAQRSGSQRKLCDGHLGSDGWRGAIPAAEDWRLKMNPSAHERAKIKPGLVHIAKR